MKSLLDVELELFGERTYSMHVTRWPIGGTDYIDDMAQAWIDGRHDEVNAWVAARAAARLVTGNGKVPAKQVRKRKSRGLGIRAWCRGRPIIDHAKVWKLRGMGWTLKKVATEVNCSVNQVRWIWLRKPSE